jgi:predicted Zn-dependent protease with MMP-like domain
MEAIMSMRAISLARKVSEQLDEIADAARNLFSAVENENDDEIEDALSQFPTPEQIKGTYQKLGHLLTQRPWETKRKKKAAND